MAESTVSAKDLSVLGRAVADFQQRYALLSSVSYGAKIARMNDNALSQEYGNTLARMDQIKRAIDSIEGAWTRAKEWAGLGALPLIPIAVAAGVTATVIAGVSAMDSFFQRAGVAEIRKDNPGITFEQALVRYEKATASTFEKTLDTAQLAMILAGAVGLYLLLR
jgi:hypothetical protein